MLRISGFLHPLGASSLAAAALLVLDGGAAVGETYALRNDGDSVVGRAVRVPARYEDTLLDIGRQFDMGYTELRLANPTVDLFLPGAGTSVLIPSQFVLPNTPEEGIVLNLPEMRLYYYPKASPGEVKRVVTHPVSIGRIGWETPRGLTRIASKIVDPVWYPPSSIRAEHAAYGDPLPTKVPPGPDNPLGRHAMRLGWAQYLIHGTNKPLGIGMRVSHGCIRMFPEDIESLFTTVAIGTPVRVINQPAKVGWLGSELYLEVHPAAAELRLDGEPDVTQAVRRIIESVPEGARIGVDWAAVERVSVERRGIPQLIGHRLDSTAEESVIVSVESEVRAPPVGRAPPHSTEERAIQSLW